MLLAVDYTPGKVFARDRACDKVTREEAQSRLAGNSIKNNDPPEILWSDDGGQFNTALDQLFQGLPYCRRTFILQGRRASDGYVEVLNRILTAMHGGGREGLARATLAYKAETKDRLGAAPETIWQTLRPLTSEWAHMAAGDATRKIDGAGGTFDAEEELNDYMQRVADWEKGGSLRGTVGSFEERLRQIMKAIGTGTAGRTSRAG